MPEEVVGFIMQYGYIAIFTLVFLQEIGMPNPIPNELVLMFSGYLTFKGLLYLPFVIITAITADFIGTNILYAIFYFSGAFLIRKKPRWIPLSEKMLLRLKERITNGGNLSIYVFRLTPFTRGYTSVITGLLHIKPEVFLPIALISAATWAGLYVILGHLLGPFWNIIITNISSFKYIMAGVLIVVVSVFIFIWFRKKRKTDISCETDLNPG
jgi:membrane protein DedA with SNARE-associated domain